MFYSLAPTFPTTQPVPFGVGSTPRIVSLFEKTHEPKTWAERVGIFKKEKPLHERHQMLQNLKTSYPNYDGFLVGDKTQVQFSHFPSYLPYRLYNFGLWDKLTGKTQQTQQTQQTNEGSWNGGTWKLNNGGHLMYRGKFGGSLSPEQQRTISRQHNIPMNDYGRLVNAYATDEGRNSGNHTMYRAANMSECSETNEYVGLSECNKDGYIGFSDFKKQVLNNLNSINQGIENLQGAMGGGNMGGMWTPWGFMPNFRYGRPIQKTSSTATTTPKKTEEPTNTSEVNNNNEDTNKTDEQQKQESTQAQLEKIDQRIQQITDKIHYQQEERTRLQKEIAEKQAKVTRIQATGASDTAEQVQNQINVLKAKMQECDSKENTYNEELKRERDKRNTVQTSEKQMSYVLPYSDLLNFCRKCREELDDDAK